MQERFAKEMIAFDQEKIVFTKTMQVTQVFGLYNEIYKCNIGRLVDNC